MKKALITGITGQDGSYLSEFLLEKGYIVHGIKRRSSSFNTERIDHLYQEEQIKNRNFILHYGDLSDSLNITKLIGEIIPDEIYNLAAMSHVAVSFDLPEYTANIDALGTLRILEAVRFLKLTKTRIYQASTSELYGKVQEIPQNESTPFYPRSPYGVAKLYAFWITKNYREAYGIYAVNGILFNHESPRRGETFVTRKITRGVVRVLKGFQENIVLGNLDSKRDWGHAKDYVRGMWMTLQTEKAEDWVFSTGITTSIRDFVKMCFNYFGIEINFKGEGINEIGLVKKCNNKLYNLREGSKVVIVSKKYFRPAEVDLLIGDSSKAKKILKWKPEFNLNSLVKDMLENDIEKINS